jgi:hypothetical protein
MDGSQATLFTFVYISWGAISVVLVVLLSYRATLLREDEQPRRKTAEMDNFQVQHAFIARKSRLTGEIIVLSVISIMLLFTCAGFSIYRVLGSF